MAATRTIRVNWHEPSKQFRKMIGKHVSRDGQLKPKTWYLGNNEAIALREATRLFSEWERIVAYGGTHWPEETPSPQLHQRNANEHVVQISHLTVADICNLYLQDIYLRADAGQCKWSHFRTTKSRLPWILNLFGRNTEWNCIGEPQIQRAVLAMTKRPAAKRRYGQRGPAQPISISFAKSIIALLKSVCIFAYELDGLLWEKPRRFDRLFKVRSENMKTVQECELEAMRVVTNDVHVFSHDDLELIWTHANQRERLFMLLGLNCGFTSGEISGLRTFEVFLNCDQPYIHRKRDKTGVEARWLLWPETSYLLATEQADENTEKRVLLTAYGNALVGSNERTRRDAIKQVWFPLMRRAEPEQQLGFRFLRKTGANAIKKLGGLEVSEMYLAHQEPGINKAYANRNWASMWDCVQQFRESLPFIQSIEAH